MTKEQLLEQVYPHIGGEQNVTRVQAKNNNLFVMVKDGGMVDLDALRTVEGVTAVDLNLTRLKVTADNLQSEEDKKMAIDNKQIAKDVLAAVGGSGNVNGVQHCMTRLRFTLKDDTIPNDEAVKNINGVVGMVRAGGQYQVIIGQNVPKVYAEVCKMGNFAAQEGIKENLDAPKEKLTPKKVGSNILNYIAGSLTPLLGPMLAAGMLRTIIVIFADVLHILPADSNLYVCLNFVYNAGFYFMPIYIGYTASKKLGANPAMGMFMGGILLAPGFMALAGSGTPFDVFGIPAQTRNYSSTVLPILLIIFVMSYVEKFFKKYVPDVLSTVFVPTLTTVVMLPMSLCLLAPAGYVAGDGIAVVLNAFGSYGGFIAVAFISAIWEYLVMSGMHAVLMVPAYTIVMSGGNDPVFMTAGHIATWAACGMALGAFLRIRHKEEKATELGYFISGLLGGVTEPVLYGLGFRFKRPFIGMSIGAAIGGLYAGIMKVTTYLAAASNFLGVLRFSGPDSSNLVHGIIACVLAMVCSAVAVYFTGFSKTEIETGRPDGE